MIYEFCAENITLIQKAEQAGAGRIELCDRLSVGGLTPSKEVMQQALQMTHLPMMLMIRLRAGNFIYPHQEIQQMRRTIREARRLGFSGFVFGALTCENLLDKSALLSLLEETQGCDVTFHMAFDQIPRHQQMASIDWLSQQGIKRVLTHGGQEGTKIEENLPWLKELVAYAEHKIMILPGGGIRLDNRENIAKTLGVEELHGTRIVF